MASKRSCQNLFYFAGCNRSIGRFCFSTSTTVLDELSYKVAIIGGGTGGASVAARLCSKIGSKNVLIIEPSNLHYYQPFWTLIGAGIKTINDSCRRMEDVLPKDVKWIKDYVVSIDGKAHSLETKNGTKIKYEFLVVAMGLVLNFQKIKGLPAAFQTPGVCSNYSVTTVQKTYNALQNFKSGNALFTQPLNPIKCAGAPQKIMYLAEDYFRKHHKRDQADIQFFTALGTIFSAPKYAKALSKVADQKQISVHYFHNLIEIKPESKEAVFLKVDEPANSSQTLVTRKYDMIHITPPMVAPVVLKDSCLADSTGFLDVNKFTLQHNKYESIFGIGDCTNVPTSKTAAAVAAQCGILTENLIAALSGKAVSAQYNGYTSCPLVTGNKKGILAEFDFDLQPLETLPFDQSKERYVHYIIKANLLPFLYWNLMMNGYWTGPGMFRKLFHAGRTH